MSENVKRPTEPFRPAFVTQKLQVVFPNDLVQRVVDTVVINQFPSEADFRFLQEWLLETAPDDMKPRVKGLLEDIRDNKRIEALEDFLIMLANAVHKQAPIVETTGVSSSSSILEAKVQTLNENLNEISREVNKLQNTAPANTNLLLQLQELAELVMQTKEKSQELTAPITLPTREILQVRLVPIHYIERLEEYRSDENKYSLLVGLFAGAILGILSNWFTSESFLITRPSILFLVLLMVLLCSSIYMSYQISKRSEQLQRKMTEQKQGGTTNDISNAIANAISNINKDTS